MCSSVHLLEKQQQELLWCCFKNFLEQLDIHLYSRVVEIGGIKDKGLYDVDMFKNNVDKNDVRVVDENIAQQMRDKIDEAKKTEIQSGRSSSNG